MDFPKKQQQSLIPRYLLTYLQDLQISHNDPTAPWGGGGGGGSYTAGDGIDITNDVISIDNTVALKTDIPSLTGYATETWVSTELLDYAELDDLATVATTGDYDDLTNKPTNVSEFTNDSGYITNSALSNYVTTDTTQTISGQKTFTGIATFQGSYFSITHQPIGSLVISDNNTPLNNNMTIYPSSLDIRGTDYRFYLSVGYLSAYNSNNEYKIKITDNNLSTTYGEYTFKNKTGDVAITSEIPTDTSDLTNNAGYITSSALSGYATETWVTNQGYVTSSSLSNYVTTTTSQTISGGKTFTGNTTFNSDATFNDNTTFTGEVTFGTNSINPTGKYKFYGRNPIAMYAPSGTLSTTGFTLYNSSNTEKGYLQYNGKSGQDALYLGRWGSSSSAYAQYIGFLSEIDNDGYRVLMPNKTNVSGAATTTANTYYIPTEFTNGTNTVKADSTGLVDISSLISGGGTTVSGTNDGTNWTSLTINSDTYGIPSGGGTTVSGTNNGTNWTSITIGSDTYGIPSGGGGGGSATANLFLHNFRLAFTTSSGVTSYIEATILTKSSTQILTIAELASQIAALQATAYDDSVIGVIYGQWYRSNRTGFKETILGFGLTGSAGSPNLYMTVPNGSGPTGSVNFVSTGTATQTIQWVNALMSASGLEVTEECTDVVTPSIL